MILSNSIITIINDEGVTTCYALTKC
jgi:hypothetical protein